MSASLPLLLSIVEIGGYPDFTRLYEQAGFEVMKVTGIRKAVKLIRKHKPSVLVAEFNFQSDFRDRTSSLETLLSSCEGVSNSKMIVFYEKDDAPQYQRFLDSFDVHASITFPIEETDLQQALANLKT